MHFALRVGGMAACSAGGSTATFKKYATIEALLKSVQSTNSSWRKRILRHGLSSWPQFSLRLGGMAAGSAGGSTATFKN